MASRRSRIKVRPNIGLPKAPSVKQREEKDRPTDAEDAESEKKNGGQATKGPETTNEENCPAHLVEDKPVITTRCDKNDLDSKPKQMEKNVNAVAHKNSGEKTAETKAETKPNSIVNRRTRIKPQVRLPVRGLPNNTAKNILEVGDDKANLSKETMPDGNISSDKAVSCHDVQGKSVISTESNNTDKVISVKPVENVLPQNNSSKLQVDDRSENSEVINVQPAPLPEAVVKDVPKSPFRRSRFQKPKPNVAEAGRNRIRHPSFTHDSEESPRKQLSFSQAGGSVGDEKVMENKKSRERTVSICSSTGVLEKGGSDDTVLINRQVSDEMLIQTYKKVRFPKKRRKVETILLPVDRSKITMKDLIYMNPVDNPMKATLEEDLRRLGGLDKTKEKPSDVITTEDMTGEDEEDMTEESAVKNPEDTQPAAKEATPTCPTTTTVEEDADEDLMPVPQLRIGPDGNIMISEESLVIKSPKNNNLADSEIIEERENNFPCRYGRRCHSKRWKLGETKKFYIALGTVGTDFTLMSKFFNGRTRTELKRKFKREEKQNRVQIEMVLSQRHDFDVSILDEDPKEDVKKKIPKPKKPPKEKKPKPVKAKENQTSKPKKKKKRSSRYFADSETESEAEEPNRRDMLSPDKSKQDNFVPVGGNEVGTPLLSSLSPEPNHSQPAQMETPNNHISTSECSGEMITTPSPAQHLSLSNLKDMGKTGQFLFVKSKTGTPVSTEGPEKSPSLIHVYMVSPSGRLSQPDKPGTPIPQPCSINTPTQITAKSNDDDNFLTPAPLPRMKKTTSFRLQPPPPGWFSTIDPASVKKVTTLQERESPSLVDLPEDKKQSTSDGAIVVADEMSEKGIESTSKGAIVEMDVADGHTDKSIHEGAIVVDDYMSEKQAQTTSDTAIVVDDCVADVTLYSGENDDVRRPNLEVTKHVPTVEVDMMSPQSPTEERLPVDEKTASCDAVPPIVQCIVSAGPPVIEEVQSLHTSELNPNDVLVENMSTPPGFARHLQHVSPCSPPSISTTETSTSPPSKHSHNDTVLNTRCISPPETSSTTCQSFQTHGDISSSPMSSPIFTRTSRRTMNRIQDKNQSPSVNSHIMITDSPEKDCAPLAIVEPVYVVSPPRHKGRRRKQKFTPKTVNVRVPLPNQSAEGESVKDNTVVTDITDLVNASLGVKSKKTPARKKSKGKNKDLENIGEIVDNSVDVSAPESDCWVEQTVYSIEPQKVESDDDIPFIPSRMQTPRRDEPQSCDDCIEEMVIDSDPGSLTINLDAVSSNVESDMDDDRTIVCEVVADDDDQCEEEGNWIVVEFDQDNGEDT